MRQENEWLDWEKNSCQFYRKNWKFRAKIGKHLAHHRHDRWNSRVIDIPETMGRKKKTRFAWMRTGSKNRRPILNKVLMKMIYLKDFYIMEISENMNNQEHWSKTLNANIWGNPSILYWVDLSLFVSFCGKLMEWNSLIGHLGVNLLWMMN